MPSGFLGRGIGPTPIARSSGRVASWQVVTTGAATHTIAAFTVSAATVVDWGDGSTDAYTGAGARTHNYAGAGTWTVRVMQPLNVTAITLNDNKVTLTSAGIASMTNVVAFDANSLKLTAFNTSDLAAWRPTTFQMYLATAGSTGAFNSADLAAWRPTAFSVFAMPTSFNTGVWNSADLTAWRPTTFYFQMPTGNTGTFTSADLTAWRPATFFLDLRSVTCVMNSAHLVDWRPTSFTLRYISILSGTFNLADLTAWRPTQFGLFQLSAGFTITLNSADVAAWKPTTFEIYGNGTAPTFTAGGGFANFTTTTGFSFFGLALSQTQVDAVLLELYQASIAPRTVANGAIQLQGSNAAPSGTFQACASPPVTAATPGKEIAYELLNDTIGAFSNHWGTVTTS